MTWRRWFDDCLQDLRYAVRLICRAPDFVAIAVGSAALGIGACAVIFAIVAFAVWTPLPVADPARLMSVSELVRRTGELNVLSYPDFRDLATAESFDGMAGVRTLVTASIGSTGAPERQWGSLVTANYFAVVRPAFAIGRGFDPATDDTLGAPPVVVLSHALWQSRFRGETAIVGRSITVNGTPATVVGVTGAGFRGTELGVVSEFWIPFSMMREVEARADAVMANRRRFWLNPVARLRTDVTFEQARSELETIAFRLNATYGRTDDRIFQIERAGQLSPELRRPAFTLFAVALAATALVLLTACSNVANLLLGRASARRAEIAARMALGASRERLIRQLLTESLMLALLGAIGGWAIAAYVTSLTASVRIPLGWPLDLTVPIDYRALLFCVGLAVVTAAAFGLVPALRATRADLVTDLKADARGGAGRDGLRLRNGLVVAQVAICMVLLLSMGLFLRSLRAARDIDLGIRNRNVQLLAFDPGLDHRPDTRSRQLLNEILAKVDSLPGVESASLTTAVPLTVIINNSNFVSAERASDPQAPRTRTDIYFVAPRFFTTMGIPLLDGKDFRFDGTTAGATAIVNDAFARAAFPGQSPIGRQVRGDGRLLDIIGVTATAKSRTIGETPHPAIFLPILSTYAAADARRGVTLAVKTRNPAASDPRELREAIRAVDPSLAIFDVRTLESHIRDALIVPRLTWALSAAAGVVGAAIGAIGVYGIISYGVARRRRELGIRLAIGARPHEILVMILRQGVKLALLGIALGLSAGLAVTRFASSLLYGVGPADPLTFVVAPSILLTVALLACLLPARAAAHVDPVEVLRSE